MSMKTLMNRKHKPVLVAVCLIALGTAWLLNNIGVMPGVNWIWTLGLAAVAVVIVGASGVDKVTVVIVPLLILASIASVLRQTGRISAKYEVPGLVIAAGILILVSYLAPVPPPAWLAEGAGEES
jgi:purine-cytosine permease-like protein